jgi:hypothetical protein
LATADGDEGIERTHSEIQRIADATPGMRRRWRGTVRIGRGAGRQRPLPVNRLSARVDDAARPSFGRANGAGGGGNDSPAAAAHAIERCEWLASAWPPEKPTISHGIFADPVSMVRRAPTDIA